MAIENKKKRNMLSSLNDSQFDIECVEMMLSISDSSSLESLSTCDVVRELQIKDFIGWRAQVFYNEVV